MNIQQVVKRQIGKIPGEVAYVAQDLHVTYAELDERANRIARVLVRLGTGLGEPVGVLMDRGEHLIPALLGILKSGAAYVPLDPAYPADRLSFIAADSGLKRIVTLPGLADRLPVGVQAIFAGQDEAAEPATDPGVDVADSDLAYIIHTSGSTGRPKGVAVEHRNTVNLLDWISRTWSRADLAGCLAASSVCFDPSVMEIFGPLAVGGTVILAENLLALPQGMPVTALGGPPPVLAALLRSGPLPATTRLVYTGGETVTAALVARVYDSAPGIRFFNCYGPTECTTQCVVHEVTEADARTEAGALPIGSPIAGAELSLRDSSGADVAEGEVGELWMSGPVVTRGYLGERFGPAYRTGDLARFDGTVYWFAGRTDDQVKVRGHRVEPGEIEYVLSTHPSVSASVVLAEPDADGTRRLLGYAESADADERELLEFLRERLPTPLVPGRLIVVPRLPTDLNGKIDRAALPALASTTARRLPRTGTERHLAEIVADVLGLEVSQVGADGRFAELGGHSLSAARVVARVLGELGVQVSLHEFLTDQTVAELARRVDAGSPAVPQARRGTGELQPLTELQRGLWALRQIEHGTPATTIGLRFRLTGVTGAGALRSALDGIVRRHEALRSIVEVHDGEPMIRVCAPAAVPVTEHDLRDLSEERRQEELAALCAAVRPLDPAADSPLLRVTCAWTGPGQAELILVTDHLVFDGWSAKIVREELAEGLAAVVSDVPDLQFGDVSEDGDAGDYWTRALADAVFPYDLLGDPAATPGHRGRRISRAIDPALLAAVGKLAAQWGVTPAALQLTALATVVGGLSARTETTIGLTATVRDRPGLDRVVGPMLDVLPVQARFADDPAVSGLATQVSAAITEALAHRAGLTKAVAAAVPRPPGANPAPVVLAIQPEDDPVSVVGDVRVELVGELDCGGAMTELTLLMNSGADGPELLVEYATDRYDAADAALVADGFLTALACIVADPATRVSALPLVTGEDQAALLALGTGPELTVPGTIVEAITRIAAEDPGRRAVESAEGSLTYGQLEDLSARIATGLLDAGTLPGEPVGVRLPRDHRMPAVLLGVLRAGAAYVPMDADLPALRVAAITAECGITRVLESHDADVLAAGHRGDLTVPDPSDLAYLIFTSGSTGGPKGIQISHRAIAAFAAAIGSDPGVSEDDVVLAMAPLVFDMSCFEFWAALSAGARVVVADSATGRDGRALAHLCASAGVTVMMATPTRLRLMLADGWQGRARLRVLVGGELFDEHLARELTELTAGAWNVYGPSEVTVVSTVHPAAAPPYGTHVPIGHPIPGERLTVVDPLGRLLPLGVPGELWLGGPGVADGYRGRPELTSAAFVGGRYRSGDLVRWLPDGSGGHVLGFLGRRDGQVKVRGYRIELGEVEQALRGFPGVADVVVLATPGPDARLVGHVVSQLRLADEDLFADLEEHARDRLPDYMVPREWTRHRELPLTVSGKIDRTALSMTSSADRDHIPAEGALQELIAEIWQTVLRAEPVGARDEFFALGGTSLLATRVTVRLREALDCDLPVWALFDHPVLADYAAEIERIALAGLADEETGS